MYFMQKGQRNPSPTITLLKNRQFCNSCISLEFNSFNMQVVSSAHQWYKKKSFSLGTDI